MALAFRRPGLSQSRRQNFVPFSRQTVKMPIGRVDSDHDFLTRRSSLPFVVIPTLTIAKQLAERPVGTSFASLQK